MNKIKLITKKILLKNIKLKKVKKINKISFKYILKTFIQKILDYFKKIKKKK